MLYTTFAKLKEKGACAKGYRKLAVHLGGVTEYGQHTLIPLDEVLESNGLDDTIWCFHALTETNNDFWVEFACRCAEHTLHFFEDKFPDDKRPRQAIEAKRFWLTAKSNTAQSAAGRAAWKAKSAAESAVESAVDSAAWSARSAWSAVDSAAWSAEGAVWWAVWSARSAARWAGSTWSAESAAWSAEREWQTQTLLVMLRAGK